MTNTREGEEEGDKTYVIPVDSTRRNEITQFMQAERVLRSEVGVRAIQFLWWIYKEKPDIYFAFEAYRLEEKRKAAGVPVNGGGEE